MQGGTSTQAPMLPHAVLLLLGVALQGHYADLLEQPLPRRMKDALSRMREVPHLLPGLLEWQQASVMGSSSVSHQPVMDL